MSSLPAAIITEPSVQGNASYGAIIAMDVPIGPGSGPPARYPVMWYDIQARDVSSSEVDTWQPRPVRSRSLRAPSTAIAAHIPAPRSTIEVPTLTGPPPASPVTDIIPDRACMSGSYPGSSRSGPLSPYARIDT